MFGVSWTDNSCLLYLGGMNENDIPAHTMLKILKEKVKQIQDERTIARKNKNVTEAKSKTDIIEKYMKIITEIEDEQPAVVSLAFTADIVGKQFFQPV